MICPAVNPLHIFPELDLRFLLEGGLSASAHIRAVEPCSGKDASAELFASLTSPSGAGRVSLLLVCLSVFPTGCKLTNQGLICPGLEERAWYTVDAQ